MLTKNMINELNKHMNLELYSSHLYLQMSAWSIHNTYMGTSKFFLKHAKEEMEHMMKLFNYLNEIGNMPIINNIESLIYKFDSLNDLINKAYNHEKKITKNIHFLVNQSLLNKDYLTFNFLQWYVSEQNEEEKIFKNMLDQLSIANNNASYLFIIDKEFGNY